MDMAATAGTTINVIPAKFGDTYTYKQQNYCKPYKYLQLSIDNTNITR